MTEPERYVATRSEPGLLQLVPNEDEPTRRLSSRRPSQPPTDDPPALVTKDRDHMAAAKKKPKRYSPEEKAAVMAKVAESSAAQVSRETGISEATISFWKKSKAKAAKKVARRAAVETNGHAEPAANGLPTLELKGLRQWVNQAVRAELAPVRKQLQNLVDAMGKAP